MPNYMQSSENLLWQTCKFASFSVIAVLKHSYPEHTASVLGKVICWPLYEAADGYRRCHVLQTMHITNGWESHLYALYISYGFSFVGKATVAPSIASVG